MKSKRCHRCLFAENEHGTRADWPVKYFCGTLSLRKWGRGRGMGPCTGQIFSPSHSSPYPSITRWSFWLVVCLVTNSRMKGDKQSSTSYNHLLVGMIFSSSDSVCVEHSSPEERAGWLITCLCLWSFSVSLISLDLVFIWMPCLSDISWFRPPL